MAEFSALEPKQLVLEIEIVGLGDRRAVVFEYPHSALHARFVGGAVGLHQQDEIADTVGAGETDRDDIEPEGLGHAVSSAGAGCCGSRGDDGQGGFVGSGVGFGECSYPSGRSGDNDVFAFHLYGSSHGFAITYFPEAVLHSGGGFHDFAQQVFDDRNIDGRALAFETNDKEVLYRVYIYFLEEGVGTGSSTCTIAHSRYSLAVFTQHIRPRSAFVVAYLPVVAFFGDAELGCYPVLTGKSHCLHGCTVLHQYLSVYYPLPGGIDGNLGIFHFSLRALCQREGFAIA